MYICKNFFFVDKGSCYSNFQSSLLSGPLGKNTYKKITKTFFLSDQINVAYN